MKHKIVIALVLFIILGSFLSAQELTLDYLEGYLDIQLQGDWAELNMGDGIPKNATVRLDEDSLAEFSGMNMNFLLTRPGVYRIEDLLSSKQTMNSSGLGSLVSGKVSSLFSERTTGPDTVGGVRASEAVTEPAVDWMTSEAADMISRARTMIEGGKFTEAKGLLDEAWDYAADDNEEQEISFYRGYIHTVEGKAGRALAEFGRISPDKTQPFYDDLFFLKGKILVDSFAFEDALAWFAGYNPGSQTRANLSVRQSVYLLHGLAAKEEGRQTEAAGLFRKVVELDPNSDTAKVASSLLQN